ncbi:hypothetical protein NDI37_10235 [Funiculus sociatus GB2-A5]|uniref:KGK domain protein n=1 Tax=Funiculus sociatus GB2-A5 TaxID=2933946 RepID=A0ABV0JQB2_9CYAN|nr:hypothetical protein [Trichocoleus sp. FACHB-832]MBD2064917.1 hypothetical protein [Trichocoleus sp. FACHB-6]
MDNQFDSLSKGEVLSVDDSAQILIGHRTFRVGEFAEAIRTQLEYGLGGWTEEKDGWFSEQGISCEVLRFGSNGWQKGKVRFTLEFSPEDSDAPQQPATRASQPVQVQAPPPAAIEEDELVAAPTAFIYEEEVILVEGPFAEDELDLSGTPVFAEDELELAETPVFDENELDMTISPVFDENELDLSGTPVFDENELDMTISPVFDENELDLSGMTGMQDDELDFAELSQNNETEDNAADSLLDDVWQDMNQGNWQNQ